MTRKPPLPVCPVFLACREIVQEENGDNLSLIGLARAFSHRQFPAAASLSFFARWTSAHGSYQVEVQLQTAEGEIVWRDGPPEPWPLTNPLEMYDLKLNLCAIFPNPGIYDFVLLANGEEVARQKFHARIL